MGNRSELFNGAPLSVPTLVEFVAAKTELPGIRTEYYISGDGVKFHFFGNPDLPKTLGGSIQKALKSYPKDSVFEEYVPEVDSWYAHIKGLSVGLNDTLVEGILRKIAAEISVGP